MCITEVLVGMLEYSIREKKKLIYRTMRFVEIKESEYGLLIEIIKECFEDQIVDGNCDEYIDSLPTRTNIYFIQVDDEIIGSFEIRPYSMLSNFGILKKYQHLGYESMVIEKLLEMHELIFICRVETGEVDEYDRTYAKFERCVVLPCPEK